MRHFIFIKTDLFYEKIDDTINLYCTNFKDSSLAQELYNNQA